MSAWASQNVVFHAWFFFSLIEKQLFNKMLFIKVNLNIMRKNELLESDIKDEQICAAFSLNLSFFFCPDVKCAGTGTNVLMSPEQGVFGYGSIDLLAGDEDEDVFSP